jgi:hypothetical protein
MKYLFRFKLSEFVIGLLRGGSHHIEFHNTKRSLIPQHQKYLLIGQNLDAPTNSRHQKSPKKLHIDIIKNITMEAHFIKNHLRVCPKVGK